MKQLCEYGPGLLQGIQTATADIARKLADVLLAD